MRIFMTGATGYIGGAVAGELRRRGHEVTALVRPDAEARHLRDLGVVLVTGEIASLPSLADTLDDHDALLHTAVSRQNPAEHERIAVETFTSRNRHLVYTSGVWILGNTRGADEGAAVNPLPISAWRAPFEESVIKAGGAVVRPGCVYGGKQSLLAKWFVAAEQKEPLEIIGDGNNHWAMVDLGELADLYARAIEQRTGGVLHGIDDTRASLNECARAVAPDANVEHVPLEDARAKLGAFADALAVDQQIDSSATRVKTGWTPRRTFVNSVAEQWQEWRRTRAATA
jgi:nucleoside-diphosphate-sugar epimerase